MNLWYRRAIAVIVSGWTAVYGLDAWSQSTRTIKIIDPFAPGAPTNVVARLLAQQIGKAHGATIVVESRGGAGSLIGTEAVARAEPDGHTLLINTAAIVINPRLRKVNYDPLMSFEPVCLLVRTPNLIAVNRESPYRSLDDLFSAARAKPGQLTLASVGPATANHIAFEMLKRNVNVDMTFVPFSGAAQAVNALLGNHVTSYFGAYPNVASQLDGGKLRALAVASRIRLESLPHVPTVEEAGVKGYEADLWFGMFTPARTPSKTVARLASWLKVALSDPEVETKLAAQGLFPAGMCGADFANFLRRQYEEYGHIIHEANIKAH